MILLVSVIIAAVVIAAPSLGIDTRLKELICQIGGGSCEEQAADNEPCVVRSSGRDANLNLQVVAVDIEQGGSYLREDRSDGTTVFTISDTVSLEGALRAGARGQVGNIGFDATAEATAGGRLEGAQQYTVQTDDADGLEDALKKQGSVLQLLRDGAESGLAGPIIDWGNDKLFGEDEPDLPEPSSEYVSLDAIVTASATAEAEAGPLGGASIEGAIEGAGGARRILSGEDEGKTEVYIQLDASAAGSLSVATLGPGVSGDASAVAVVTLDEDLRPIELGVTATAGYEGSLNIGDELEGAELGDLAGILEEASIGGSSGGGKSLEFGAKLDLTDQENLDAATRLLTQGGAGVPGLIERFDEDGTLTLQASDTSSDSTEVGFNVGLGLNGGGGGSQGSSDSETTSALIRQPGDPGFSLRDCG